MLAANPNPQTPTRCTPRPCPDCHGQGRIEHPAWRAIRPIIGPEPRFFTAETLAQYEQMALQAMIAAGYEDDCLFTEFTPVYQIHFYALPPRWIPCACTEPVEVNGTLFDGSDGEG